MSAPGGAVRIRHDGVRRVLARADDQAGAEGLAGDNKVSVIPDLHRIASRSAIDTCRLQSALHSAIFPASAASDEVHDLDFVTLVERRRWSSLAALDDERGCARRRRAARRVPAVRAGRSMVTGPASSNGSPFRRMVKFTPSNQCPRHARVAELSQTARAARPALRSAASFRCAADAAAAQRRAAGRLFEARARSRAGSRRSSAPGECSRSQ